MNVIGNNALYIKTIHMEYIEFKFLFYISFITYIKIINNPNLKKIKLKIKLKV
jgi:hypothetical protein